MQPVWFDKGESARVPPFVFGNAIFERYLRWRVVGFLDYFSYASGASSVPTWYHLKSDVVM